MTYTIASDFSIQLGRALGSVFEEVRGGLSFESHPGTWLQLQIMTKASIVALQSSECVHEVAAMLRQRRLGLEKGSGCMCY
jgi:hypothetical protein